LFFRKESALKNYLIGGIGRFGPLQNLRRARSEHKLPSGHRVDILCEENRRDGKGALVAIELKRDKSADAVSKLNQYLVELQREHADRSVRGMIISGSASDADVKLVGQIKSVPIDWYIYTLELKKV